MRDDGAEDAGLRVVFAANGLLGARVLSALLDSRHKVVALLGDGRRIRGAMRWIRPRTESVLARNSSPASIALRSGIPIHYIDRMTPEELAPLRALNVDLLLVAGFGIILKRPLLDLPRLGSVNTHSSLLPRHRGPNPFRAAILAAEEETGVTFHRMTEGIDNGEILAQYAFPVPENATAGALIEESADVAAENVCALLDAIQAGTVQPAPQDESLATYEKNLNDKELFLDWEQPAEALERMVRACYPFTPARLRHRGRIVYVYRVECEDSALAARPGEVLAVDAASVSAAAGDGALRITQAFSAKPVPWIWPAPWRRPKRGERLQ